MSPVFQLPLLGWHETNDINICLVSLFLVRIYGISGEKRLAQCMMNYSCPSLKSLEFSKDCIAVAVKYCRCDRTLEVFIFDCCPSIQSKLNDSETIIEKLQMH